MGQHKFNETARRAAAGELPPKPRKPGKRSRERMIAEAIAERTGLGRLMDVARKYNLP